MRIYISGLHSGPNPSPGVGIARALRAAYPDAELVGVDYSNRSSGLHWPDFDRIWLQRPWAELDLETYQEQIAHVLDSGAFWIPGLDIEARWLAQGLHPHPRLLIPPVDAFVRTCKPAIEAHQNLPVSVPAFLTTNRSDWDLYTFCRKHAWRVWVKGRYYEAHQGRSWPQVIWAREMLTKTWSTEDHFLQAHVAGYEETIALSAYQGELLDCVYLSKRDTTIEGKSWSGRVSEVPADYLTRLREVIHDLNWTGGAELEMMRDEDGQLWMLDWNPRYPAWIYGAVIAGQNLPALLVERASGVPARHLPQMSREFTRVVFEVPVRDDYPLAPPPEPNQEMMKSALKHPSDMTSLVERLHDSRMMTLPGETNTAASAPPIPATIMGDLASIDLDGCQTPHRLFLPDTASSLFQQVIDLRSQFQSSPVEVAVAYSIKTNPDDRLLQLALDSGCLAEAISQREIQRAMDVGFCPQQVILNGPGKWWPQPATQAPLHAIFCDSIEELRRLISEGSMNKSSIFGVRLRPSMVDSRFGISLDDYGTFQELVTLIKQIPLECALGVHVHMASSFIGVNEWWNLIDSILGWCQAIERASGRRVKCLDLGGGWFPDDWQASLSPRLASIVSDASEVLPELRQILLEPGKALAQPAMALAVRVLEVRYLPDQKVEIVVDGSIAEMPTITSYPHRILMFDVSSRRWQSAPRGNGRILGRLCMEEDVLAQRIEIPCHTKPGDVLVLADAGAYDRSMSYVFGQG